MTRLDDAQDKRDIENITKQLLRDDLLSEEQYKKLLQLEEVDLPIIADIIKETKIGQELKFLPMKLNDLTKNLKTWLEELAETGSTTMKNKITGILLFRESSITDDEKVIVA